MSDEEKSSYCFPIRLFITRLLALIVTFLMLFADLLNLTTVSTSLFFTREADKNILLAGTEFEGATGLEATASRKEINAGRDERSAVKAKREAKIAARNAGKTEAAADENLEGIAACKSLLEGIAACKGEVGVGADRCV